MTKNDVEELDKIAKRKNNTVGVVYIQKGVHVASIVGRLVTHPAGAGWEVWGRSCSGEIYLCDEIRLDKVEGRMRIKVQVPGQRVTPNRATKMFEWAELRRGWKRK